MSFRRECSFGILDDTSHVVAIEYPAAACGCAAEDVTHEFKEWPANILERWHGKVPFRAVDDFRGQKSLVLYLLE